MKLKTLSLLQKVKSLFLKTTFLSLLFVVLCSHDLYIKMETYFLKPNTKNVLSLYNGTFLKSENIITRDRILDASIVSDNKRKKIDSKQWVDKDTTITQLNFNTAKAGTYVVGVSTKAKNIELSAEKFNDYLKHDGVLDILNQRTQENLLNEDALENYQKHVKAIYQVGDTKTNDWKTALNYPIEFIPQENPYTKFSGDQLAVQLLHEGKPLSNQLVYADYIKNNHSHTHSAKDHDHEHSDGNHTHTSGQKIRTDNQGIATINLPEEGIYYLRTIYMTTVSDDSNLTHKSKWATLTFEVSHKHDSSTHTHENSSKTIPLWIFIVGSVIFITVLFLIFRKK